MALINLKNCGEKSFSQCEKNSSIYPSHYLILHMASPVVHSPFTQIRDQAASLESRNEVTLQKKIIVLRQL